VDNHKELSEGFDRIAYFLELQGSDGDTQYVYASMDPFTRDARKIGLPAVSIGAFFQQPVTNLNVLSNVKGIVTGSGLVGGNIEFWPNNYAPNNSAKVPNASDSVYDFGDAPTEPKDGYGSMQLHNHDARQTVFAVNNWKAGGRADIGIGNQAQGNPDWTFAANAASYVHKRLRVLVHIESAKR
jgi:sialate O-acetylesterase